jgi:hypothetical protein
MIDPLVCLTDCYEDVISLDEVHRGDGAFVCIEVFENDHAPNQVLMTPKQARALSEALGAFAERNGE